MDMIIQTLYKGVDEKWVKWWIKNQGSQYPSVPPEDLIDIEKWTLRKDKDPASDVVGITQVKILK